MNVVFEDEGDEDGQVEEEGGEDVEERRAPLYACEVDEDGVLGVPPEIWESVMVFAACWNQWSVIAIPVSGGMGVMSTVLWYEGLDNSKVRDTMAMMKVKNERQVLEDLRVMEAEARVVRNRKANGK